MLESITLESLEKELALLSWKKQQTYIYNLIMVGLHELALICAYKYFHKKIVSLILQKKRLDEYFIWKGITSQLVYDETMLNQILNKTQTISTGWLIDIACKNNQLQFVKFFYFQKVRPSRSPPSIYSSLCVVSDYGNRDLLNWLIEHGSDVYYCLPAACVKGNLDTVKWLIDKCYPSYLSTNYLNFMLFGACKSNNIDVIDHLIGLGANDFERGMVGACENGNIHLVKKMIQLGAKDFQHGLSTARYSNHTDIVKLMLYHGASEMHSPSIDYTIPWNNTQQRVNIRVNIIKVTDDLVKAITRRDCETVNMILSSPNSELFNKRIVWSKLFRHCIMCDYEQTDIILNKFLENCLQNEIPILVSEIRFMLQKRCVSSKRTIIFEKMIKYLVSKKSKYWYFNKFETVELLNFCNNTLLLKPLKYYHKITKHKKLLIRHIETLLFPFLCHDICKYCIGPYICFIVNYFATGFNML